VLGVGAGGDRPLPLTGWGVSPPENFVEIFDAKFRVWGQFEPENKLIEGQPNEYDVIRQNAPKYSPERRSTAFPHNSLAVYNL